MAFFSVIVPIYKAERHLRGGRATKEKYQRESQPRRDGH